MSDIAQKIVRLTDIRATLWGAIAPLKAEYDAKHKTYNQMVEHHNATTQSRPSESYRQSYGEVYQQVHDKIKELEVEIEQRESQYNRECSSLASLEADIARRNADIRMEISNYNFQVAARPGAVSGNNVVAKQYGVGLLISQRDRQLASMANMRATIDELKQECDSVGRIFIDMNTTIISWLDDDKVQQATADSIEAQLAEMHIIMDEIYDILRQVKDVDADIKKYQSM